VSKTSFTLLMAAVLGTSCASAAAFNAVTGFSLTTNTAANRWSYWGTPNTNVSTYAANVALLPVLFNGTCGVGTSCWDETIAANNLVLQNVTGVDALGFPNSDARNNQLTYYNRTGVVDVRFLVPTTGSYSLSGFFEGSANAPEATRDLIVVNSNVGSPLFNLGPALDPFGTVNNFSFASLSLSAGDIVDFLVAGTQTTPDQNSLATGFNATFTQGTSGVPEPGTIGIVASGLALIAWKRRKLLGR
jgi:PEP-CTERM motif-containing protein